jgi:hypothetical protein
VIPLALAASGLSVWQSSHAAFSGTGPPLDDAWTGGLVQVSATTPGTATFAPPELVAGSSGERCITVVTADGRPTGLRAYVSGVQGSPAVTGRLRLTVDQGRLDARPPDGSAPGVGASCTGFSGATVFVGTLAEAATHDSLSTGLGSVTASAVTYRFRWELPGEATGSGDPQPVIAVLHWAQGPA